MIAITPRRICGGLALVFVALSVFAAVPLWIAVSFAAVGLLVPPAGP